MGSGKDPGGQCEFPSVGYIGSAGRSGDLPQRSTLTTTERSQKSTGDPGKTRTSIFKTTGR